MDRPYIVIRVAATVDGRISIGPNLNMFEEMADPRTQAMGGAEVWASFEQKIEALHRPQADMLGSNSVVAEGESLQELPPYEGDPGHFYADFLPNEVIGRPDHAVWLVVVDGRGRLRSGYRGDDQPGRHMLHLVSHAAPPSYLAFLRDRRIPYLIAGRERVDLPEVMGKLRKVLGVTCLSTSAGGRLSGALLRNDLVDEINLLVQPQLNGGFTTPCLFDSPDLEPDQWPTRLRLVSAEVQEGDRIWLRYEVDRDRPDR